MEPGTSERSGIAEGFHRDGFVLVPGVFEEAELLDLAEHVLHVRQPPPELLAKYNTEGFDLNGHQSLADFEPQEISRVSRMLRLHLFDARTRAMMLDPRMFDLARALWPGEPLAVHALYFPKPPASSSSAVSGCSRRREPRGTSHIRRSGNWSGSVPARVPRWLTYTLEARLTAAFDEEAARVGLTLSADDRTLVAFDRKLNAQGLAYAAGRASA